MGTEEERAGLQQLTWHEPSSICSLACASAGLWQASYSAPPSLLIASRAKPSATGLCLAETKAWGGAGDDAGTW